MLLSQFIKDGTSALEELYPTAEAHSVVLALCEHVLGTKNYTHIVEPSYEIASSKLDSLLAAFERLKGGEPIQYVTGHVEFYGHDFKVNPSVLIPRPETELLCRNAIAAGSRIQRMRIPYGKKADPVRILDLCTGSGCIAWTLALAIPDARVVGVDISEEALDLARSQPFGQALKEVAGAKAPEFVKADVLDTEQDFPYGEFDLILSNPPYVMEKEKTLMRRNVLEFEPASALFVPDDDPLIFYRAIARWSGRFFSNDGTGFTEINEDLGTETKALFTEAGFNSVEIIKDFYDKNRFVTYRKQTSGTL
ncbi:MAG: peptide chain release factor N(5)-glutamine methyltransferase [Bacteroidales bacterium]|nr:peptide chain release factor N(5)-glutamine methyltransferase [Bacteroidales bacterium]